MAFIAGHYTGEISPDSGTNWFALGDVEDGFTLTVRESFEQITVDRLGDSVVDGVYRGGNCFLDFILSEWNSAVITDRIADAGTTAADTQQNLFWPFGGRSVTVAASEHTMNPGDIGTRGRLISEIDFNIRLTRTTGNQLDNIDGIKAPDRIYAKRAQVTPEFARVLRLANRHRKLPVQLQLFPYTYTSGENTIDAWFQFQAVA